MRNHPFGTLLTLCLSILAFSCVNKVDEPDVATLSEGDEIFAGIQVETPATRTSVADLNVLWSEGDLLSVFPKMASNSKYILKSGAGEAFGVFTRVQGPLTGKSLPGYAAVYPYGETVTVERDGTVSLVFPSVQTYAEDSFGPEANPMVAWSQDTHLSFYNVGAYLLLPLKGNARVSAVEVTALDGETLSGQAEVKPGEDGPAMDFPEGAEGSDAITLLCNEPVWLDEEEETPFWIVVPPVTLEKGFNVTVTCLDGTVIEQAYAKKAVFERNHIFRMDPLEVAVEKTCLDYVKEGYRTLAANFPNAKDHFVEARFVLNDIIADTDPEELKAESVTVYCYTWVEGYSEIDVLERDFNTGETQMYQYFSDSPWVGDKFIPESELKTLRFSLEEALLNAKNDADAAAGDGLDTRYVTLRKPLWPVWDNPQYVVGGSASRSSHVFVDALDGKVLTLAGGSAGGEGSLVYLVEDQNIIRDMYWMDEILGFPLEIRDCFREVHYVLNKPMNAGQLLELFAKDAIYVYYVPARDGVTDNYLIRGIRDLTKGFAGKIETEAEVVTEPWTGGDILTPDPLDAIISLEDAMYVVKLGNVTDPDTADVTLCQPVGSPNPLYIFRGVDTPSVVVDAITGEIVTD
ncbi:MAG: hypothetical protein II851_07830 [Bacteroidales bacterium]|nr:hypothetical protein [Bacteroidales bacterium]